MMENRKAFKFPHLPTCMALTLSEQNTVLYPAVYNRLGILGDFEVMIEEGGELFSLVKPNKGT